MKRIARSMALSVVLSGLIASASTQEHQDAAAGSASGSVLKSYHPLDLPLRERILENIFARPSDDPSVPTRMKVTLPDLGLVSLELTPVSIRADGYQLLVQQPDGKFESVDPGPESTYSGRVMEHPGSVVAASFEHLNWFAMIRLQSGATFWVQPLWDAVKHNNLDYMPCPTIHLIYRGSDTLCAGVCSQPDVDPPLGGSGDNPTPHGGCGTDELPCIAELAIDVDFEYFQAHGANNGAIQDRISAIINVVNHQFQRDVHVTHRLVTIQIRTVEPDPYTTAGATDLLNQVKADWVANGGGFPRDLVQLFTGRDLTGSDTGAAFDAAVCNDEFHYSLVQSDFSSLFACVTDNSAHFLGHLWGATHCACPASTMNATLSCANTFGGEGSTSISEINNFLESATCLSSEGFAPPNDRCDHAIVVTESGTYIGTNVGASNDGGMVTSAFCGVTAGGGVRDIYWTFTPAASGPVTVSTCATTSFFFDTIISIHSGCPATPENLVNCNDDCTGCVLRSCITFNATAGAPYYARISGFDADDVGQITVDITLPAAPLCAGDLDCDDDRDPADIPHFVQALIDPAGYSGSHACSIDRANLNGDSATDGRDIAAFAALLISGSCP